MSRDSNHGGEGWGFGECLWSPIKKQGSRSSWRFWENLLEVKKGDTIVHICWEGDYSYFSGVSLALTDGYKSSERPPDPGQWGHNTEFYRVDLEDYVEMEFKVSLDDLFVYQKEPLIEFYKTLPKPKNVFYVLQGGKLRCLEGAYLSKCPPGLLEIFFDTETCRDIVLLDQVVNVGEKRKIQNQRAGQQEFSRMVKQNYSYMCCFPQCGITDKGHLVGAHIARWTDNKQKRGNVSNGLCLCSFHDKAFETGYFSLDNDFKIICGNICRCPDNVVYDKITKHEHEGICRGSILPDLDALKEHRLRHGIKLSNAVIPLE